METLVSFKKAPNVKFNRNEAVLLQKANNLMEQDFEGMGCDPNFDVNYDNMQNYLKMLGVDYSKFTEVQVNAIKNVFCL